MAIDLTVHLTDQPGELARLADVLADADVNIEGFCAVTNGGGLGEVHLLIDDPAPAFEALAAAGIEVAHEEEVAVVDVEDRPGALAEVSGRLWKSGVNITSAYLATRTRLVFAADDLGRARAALD